MFLGKITSNYQKYCLNAISTLVFSLIGMLLFSQQNVFAVNTSIAITGNAVINQATPTKDGTNYFRTLNLNVKTDSDSGYELYISSDKEDSALTSTDPLNTFKINSVSGNNNYIDNMKNQFGYNIADTDNHYYNQVPKLSTPALLVTTQDASEDNYKLNIGMRLDRKVPSGDYQGKIIFTVLSEKESKANIVTGREFNTALRTALGIKDTSLVNSPETQIPDDRKYYPDLILSIGQKKCADVNIRPNSIVKISTPDSESDVYMGIYRPANDWDKICIWSKATEFVFPEDLSYMFAGFTGTGYNLKFEFRDRRSDKMLNFSKVNNISHILYQTKGWSNHDIDSSEFFAYFKNSPIKNIESAFEDSTVSSIGDVSFAKHANKIARAFKNTDHLGATDFSSWEVSDADDATSLFENSAIPTIELPKATFKKTTSTANMFKNSKAGTIDLSTATFEKSTDASYMFNNSSASTITFPLANFNETTNAKSMFENARQLSSLDLKHAKFDKVKDFSNFLKNTTSLYVADLSSLKFTSAEDLSYMFSYSRVENLTLNPQDMGGDHITNMAFMFEECYIKEADLGRIHTGELTDVKGMFKGTSYVTKITLPQVINTSKVTDFSYMFTQIYNLAELNNFDKINTISALDMNHMFERTILNATIDFSLLKTNAVTDLSYMFYQTGLSNNVSFSPGFNTSHAVTMESMFESSSSVVVDLSHFSFTSVENMSKMFSTTGASAEGKECSGYGPSEVTWPATTQPAPVLTTLKSLFHGNCGITKIKAPKITAPNLKDTSFAFSGLGEITEINLDGFDTSAVENMQAMFSGNSYGFMKNQHIKISLNTSSVKNMSKLFYDTYVSYLDLSDFNVSNVTNLSSAFDYTWLYEVDLTNWDTHNVTDMSNLFRSSTWITKIYASDSFVTTNVTAYSNIFALGDSYRGQAGSTVPASSLAHARIDGGSAAPGAFWRK